MREQLLVGQQVALGVLHADGGVDRARQTEIRHVADDQLAANPLASSRSPRNAMFLGERSSPVIW